MRAEHPDRVWLDGVVRAIDAWLDAPVTTPTSQLAGGGAIARGEERLSARHEGRPALLVPSATYALWVALRALGVRAGDEVLVPRHDWTSSLAVVLALGAVPVIVPADPATLTIDPEAAAARATARTRALIATHLLGVPADVPALRAALPRVPIVEDCAQAFGSTLDGRPVGVFGDAAILSFGPGKRIDVGELGALVLRDGELRRRALQEAAHPVRQRMDGIVPPAPAGVSIRPHPLAAVLLDAALDADDAAALIQGRRRLAARVARSADLPLVGVDARRGVASATIPVLADTVDEGMLPAGILLGHGAVDDIASVRDGSPTSLPLLLIAEGGVR